MPIGPTREKRPADAVANALLVTRIATGNAEDIYVNPGQSWGGRKDSKALAEPLSAEQPSEIARHAAQTPWHLGEVEEGLSE